MAADIWRLRDTMRSAWQGDAADAAGTGAEPLAMEFLNSADYLHSSQDLLSRQTGSFHSAANSVQPVPAAPSAVDIIGSAAFGIPSMQNRVHNYLATSQHNVDVFGSYHGASQFNTTNMPSTYGRIAMDTADVAVAQPQAALPATSAASAGDGSGHRAPSGTAARQPPSSGVGGPPVTHRAVVSPPRPGVVTSDASGTARFDPSGPTVAAGAGDSGLGTPSGGSHIRSVLSGGGTSASGGSQGATRGFVGDLGLPGAGADVPGAGGFEPDEPGLGGARGLGGGGSRAFGEGVGPPGGRDSGDVGGSRGSGGSPVGKPVARVGEPVERVGQPGVEAPRSGVSPERLGGSGAAVEEGSAGRDGVSEPMAPFGGRSGRGGRDGERRVPDYLKEPDPEDVFGDKTAVAPPVIGE